MKDLMKMMKQAQELKGRMEQMQSELEEMAIEGRSGAGLVSVTLNGKGTLKALKIDPTLMKPDEVEIVEDLVVAAYQDAQVKVAQAASEKMQDVTGGLPLPAGFNPFGGS
ncbi:MAG: YbaB/EbfC family nucleoid-associated protein [Pseudomonadota bacterium]